VVIVAPSILACDFARLSDEAKRAEEAGADQLHVDVMDGHFVRNITIGPLVVEAVRRSTGLPLNVHLMIDNPELYAKDFIDAGAGYILVHPECTGDPRGALEITRERGVRTGVALNPETPVSAAEPYLADIDFVLVMSVNPGWGGQKFMPEVLPKFAEAKRLCRADVELGIDGGINFETAREAVKAGCNCLVAGTFLFGSDDMPARIEKLRHIRQLKGET
jgi:ribulose-phosphate 3-epimerase